MFEMSRFAFPLFSAIPEPDRVRIQRFIGGGFWLDEHGHFATCKHVLDSVAEGQVAVIGQPGGPQPDRFRPVRRAAPHERYDVAVGRAPRSAVSGVLAHYSGPVALGLDVQAFGYTEAGKEGDNYNVDPRLLRGHVSRHAPSSYGLPSPSLLEVSFGSPSGFSGMPLLVGTEVVGLLYSNIDSRLQAYSISETIDGGAEFRETAYRIYEYGIAHLLCDIQPFLTECGVGTAGGV